jgi:hydroxypyruvate reductase
MPPPAQVTRHAQEIWRAALDAVRSERLMREAIHVDGHWLVIEDQSIDLNAVRQIAVVGGGKAGSGMAAELEAILGERFSSEKQLTGWVNVPNDCVRTLSHIHLHAARPAGCNEPTEAGASGVNEMLRMVESMGDNDLCIALISGGGSALMPAPVDGISLADKLHLTRYLSAAGANIAELNTVRKRLSKIKGGGLAGRCRAGRLVSLIISDVLGDPHDVIASGPTTASQTRASDALAVLERFSAVENGIAPRAVDYLRRQTEQADATIDPAEWPAHDKPTACETHNFIIGNNATAVDAAGIAAERLGYSHAMIAATMLEGAVEQIGRHLADMAITMRNQPGPDCLISGGEGTVTLAPEAERGLGGRNQQLVLAAFDVLFHRDVSGIAILSGGTDGEDGPTDAAGAWLDADVVKHARTLGLSPADYLRRNDAYHFFAPLGALLKTGPTNTNVCDVRVVVVERKRR